MQERYTHIDMIRATGIVLMILTHVLSWHFGEPYVYTIWNAIHFVVVGLVFCSAYLYATKNKSSDFTHHSLQWFSKRIVRLYIPFLIYLCIHYILWFLFPSFIRGYGIQKTWKFFFESVTLTGGVDIGWLTTLFVQFAVIFPFILPAFRKTRLRLILLISLTCIACITTFWRIPTIYTRLVGWIPWSLAACLGFYIADNETAFRTSAGRRHLFTLFGGFFVILIFLFTFLSESHASVQFTTHKYPPDLFYLSYGALWTICLYILTTRMYISKHIMRGVQFISRESYALFFCHMIVLDFVMTRIPSTWYWETVMIIFGSVAILFLFRLITRWNLKRRQ